MSELGDVSLPKFQYESQQIGVRNAMANSRKAAELLHEAASLFDKAHELIREAKRIQLMASSDINRAADFALVVREANK